MGPQPGSLNWRAEDLANFLSTARNVLRPVFEEIACRRQTPIAVNATQQICALDILEREEGLVSANKRESVLTQVAAQSIVRKGDRLITVFRTTSLIPHKFNAYLDLYGREGWPVEQEALGDCGGCYVVEIGLQQQLVQIWRCRDLSDWTDRRDRLRGHPRWRVFRAGADALILEQSERAYRPA